MSRALRRVAGLCLALSACRVGAPSEPPARPAEEEIPGEPGAVPDGATTVPGDDGSPAVPDAGGARDAVAPDRARAAAVDARPVRATPTPPCASGALACDDFESYKAGGTPAPNWRTVTVSGALRIDTTHAFSGDKSVHFTTNAWQGYGRAMITKEGAPLFPVANNMFYGRMMLWLTSNPSLHWVVVSPAGGLPTGESGSYRFGGGPTWGLAYGTATLDCAKSSKVRAPVGRWVCIEWKIDGSRDEQRYWVDGQPINELTVIGKAYCFKPNKTVEWQAPLFTSISLGWEHYLSAPAAEGWIDDVVIDDQPIGCPQPGATTR